jgi:outer membrane murein-binding lipoprotein Lpp
MPGTQTLDKDWIDQNLSYLQPRLGTFPLFEPSELFYLDLARHAGTEASISGSAGPLRLLYSHLGLPGLVVHFEDHIPNAGEFRFSEHPENLDIIIPVCIRIADKYRQIKDPQRRGMAIATILAHEIAHYYLLKKKIRRETTDNERLTDLGLVVLGFGKLWFNGSQLVVGDRPEQMGYLKPLDMTYAYMEYGRKNRIPGERLVSGLSPEAAQRYTSLLGNVVTSVRTCNVQEALDNKKEIVRELASRQAALEAEVQKLVLSVNALQPDLAAAADNQEIVNRTIHFWDIPAEDHCIMASFVNAWASGAPEAERGALIRSVSRLRQEVQDLGTGLQQPSALNCDPAIFQRTLGLHRETLAALGGRVDALRQQAGAVTSVHERCFAQIGSLHREVQEIQDVIRFGRRDLNEVRTLHAFFSANPAVWPAYAGDAELQVQVSLLIRPEGAASFAATEQELTGTAVLIPLTRKEYAVRLGKSPPVTEIRDRLRTGRDRVVRSRQSIAGILSVLEHIPDRYLEGVRDLERRQKDLRVSCTDLENDIRKLKPRQDRIFARHDRLSIRPGDDADFAAITHAVFSCSPETELSAVMRRLAGAVAALSRDAERVRDRKEPCDILTLEEHEKELGRVRSGFGLLSGRVDHWIQVQQGYIDRLDERERPSVGNFLRNAGDTIRAAVAKKKR